MLVFPKNAEKNASTIEKGLAAVRRLREAVAAAVTSLGMSKLDENSDQGIKN